MAKKQKSESEKQNEPKEMFVEKKPKAFNKYTVTNRHNYPQEISGLGFCIRFEPRGHKGDTIVLEEKIFNSVSFQTQKKYFVIKEMN